MVTSAAGILDVLNCMSVTEVPPHPPVGQGRQQDTTKMVQRLFDKSEAPSQFAASRSIKFKSPPVRKTPFGQPIKETYVISDKPQPNTPSPTNNSHRDSSPRSFRFRNSIDKGTNPSSKEIQPQESQSPERSHFRKTQSNPSSNFKSTTAQISHSAPVDATILGSVRPGSRPLVIHRVGQVNKQPDMQSNESQFTRPSPVNAMNLGADPSKSPNLVIRRLDNQFRTIRKGGRTGDGRSGNFSRDKDDRYSRGAGRNEKKKGDSSKNRRRGNNGEKELTDLAQERSPEEIQYRETTEAAKWGSLVPFSPEEPTLENLSGLGPALAVSTQGLSEIVGERLQKIDKNREDEVREVEILARAKVAGRTPRFKNKEQEALTLKRVEQILTMNGNREVQTEKEKEREPDENNTDLQIPQETKDALVHQLLSGSYHMVHPAVDGPRDILAHVQRLANRNGSYHPTNEQALLRKIKTLLPVAAEGGPRPRARTGNVKA